MTLRGIDISQWQWPTPDLSGLDFVIVRGTYGTGFDTRENSHILAAHERGLPVGAYGFGVYGSGAAQAQALLRVVPDADFYALDLEPEAGKPEMTAAQARDFIAEMHRQGVKCGLYHSKSGYPADALGADWRWVAAWDGIDPGPGWTFHQYRGSPLDLDYFNGDAQALAAFVRAQRGGKEHTVPTSTSPLAPSAQPVMYATILTGLLVSGGLLTTEQATSITPQLAILIGAAFPILGLILRQFVWAPANVTPNGDGTATPNTPDVPVTPPVTPPAPAVIAVSKIVTTTPLPAGTKGRVEGTTRRWDGEDPYPELDPIEGEHVLALKAKVVLANSQEHAPNGTFFLTDALAPVLIQMANMAVIEPTATAPEAPVAEPSTVIDKTTRPDLFASAPVITSPVSLGAFDPSGAAGKFGPGTPQAAALGADTPYMIEGQGGNLLTFSRQTAWQWWQAYCAAPFDLRLVAPGAMPGSLVLNPDQYAIAVAIGKQILPPPPASFPFPLPLNPYMVIGGGTLEATMQQIAQGNPSFPRFDPRVSFTADGIVIEGR